MVEPFRDIDADRVAANLAEVRAAVPAGTAVLVACKYVPSEEMAALAAAGVELVGENRLGDLEEKHERWAGEFTFDFIGNVQSRKVREILPLVRLIHSVHSASVMKQLARHGDERTEVLIQVNVAGEEGKGGVDPDELGAAIEACPVRVVGLSTMPPFTDEPELSRPHFARLAELGREHRLERLSMGTSQDWRVAVEEGATTIRLGSTLFR
jgi:uncharacterized pyridoxal phosphate-containing UPF0001 family protein